MPNSCDLTPVSTEDSSVKSEFESVTEKINSMTLNSMNFALPNDMDDDEEFLRNEQVFKVITYSQSGEIRPFLVK